MKSLVKKGHSLEDHRGRQTNKQDGRTDGKSRLRNETVFLFDISPRDLFFPLFLRQKWFIVLQQLVRRR